MVTGKVLKNLELRTWSLAVPLSSKF